MLNFLQKHLVVCNSRLILGTITVSESVRLTEKWRDIKPHNNYSFHDQGTRISSFLWIKLPSPRLHAYTFPLVFLWTKTIKYSMSYKINTRFSEYTNGYIFCLFSLLSVNYFFPFICDASIEITCDENLQCKSIQLT